MHDVSDHVDDEELRGVHSSSGTIWAIKSRNMGRVRHVETLRRESCLQNIGQETCGEDNEVFHSVRSCTSNTSSVFQTNAHFYLLHMFICITLTYMFRCVVYTIFRENPILLAQNHLFF